MRLIARWIGRADPVAERLAELGWTPERAVAFNDRVDRGLAGCAEIGAALDRIDANLAKIAETDPVMARLRAARLARGVVR